MRMLPKSRKIAIGLKVFSILTVTATYAILDYLSEEPSPSAFYNSNLDHTHHNGRKLLALPTTINATTINATTTNCTKAAINEFPSDGFTREQRQKGWIVVHVFLSCYLFTLLAIVCDDYFVPSIKHLCDKLHLRQDIAGATFMAMASSSPELFINCVGTFVTEGDIGVGAIVGSAVFNILAVPACCGLFGSMVIYLDWWPVSRDSIFYGVSVILLISFLQDGKIYLYEALTLILVYIIYVLMMFFNTRLMNLAKRTLGKCRGKRRYKEIIAETTPLLSRGVEKVTNGGSKILEKELTLKDCEEQEEATKIWEWPSEQSVGGQLWWMITWPISFFLNTTTPDCRKYPKLFVYTFIMCVLWIGMTSYLISWLITAIGDTLNIPDSVMGLTFLAAGMSVPEGVSSVLVTNQGYGAMGVSSSIASNSFDILLCLGVPWFIKTIKTGYYPKVPPGQKFIKINSGGLSYNAISLLSTLILYYLSLALNRFRLDWKIGLTCLIMYFAFLIVAAIIELNVFFTVNLPTCDR